MLGGIFTNLNVEITSFELFFGQLDIILVHGLHRLLLEVVVALFSYPQIRLLTEINEVQINELIKGLFFLFLQFSFKLFSQLDQFLLLLTLFLLAFLKELLVKFRLQLCICRKILIKEPRCYILVIDVLFTGLELFVERLHSLPIIIICGISAKVELFPFLLF